MKKFRTTSLLLILVLAGVSLSPAVMADGISIGRHPGQSRPQVTEDEDMQGMAYIASGSRVRSQPVRGSGSIGPALIGGFILGSIIASHASRPMYVAPPRLGSSDFRIGPSQPLTLLVSDEAVERELQRNLRATLRRPLRLWIEGDVRDALISVSGRRLRQETRFYDGQPFIRLHPEDFNRGEEITVVIEAGHGRYSRSSVELRFLIR